VHTKQNVNLGIRFMARLLRCTCSPAPWTGG
jgi:hypothetical protein